MKITYYSLVDTILNLLRNFFTYARNPSLAHLYDIKEDLGRLI